MALHLFYKEWLKTKWFVLASLLLGVGTILYAFIVYTSRTAALWDFQEYPFYHCLVDWRITVFAGGLAKKNKIDLTLTVE